MHPLSPACNCYQCLWRIHHCLWWYSLPEKGHAPRAQSITSSKMGSPPPSPRSMNWAESCFAGNASRTGTFDDSQKRSRELSSSPARGYSKKVIPETLLPEDSQSVQAYQLPIPMNAAPRAVGIVQETPTAVPCSQSQQPPARSASEGDAASDDDSVDEELDPKSPQSAIPSDWTAGKAVAVHCLCVCVCVCENLYSF
jgi:hypothetical protein